MTPEHQFVVDLLYSEYEIAASDIYDGVRGWVGETFVVTDARRRRYFAKLVPVIEPLLAVTSRLQVLEALRPKGIERVTYPLRNKEGNLVTEVVDNRYLTLYDFIGGQPGSRTAFDFDQSVALLAQVHKIDPTTIPALHREEFLLPWAAKYEELYEQVLSNDGGTDVQKRLHNYILDHRAEIDDCWIELQALAVSCRVTTWAPRLTHSDALDHNLLVNDAGEVFLIDWDEMMIGPVERDNWIYMLNEETAANFLRVYRQTFPGYCPNQQFLRYYLLRRFFEDIIGYIEKIREEKTEEAQLSYLVDFEDSWYPWLWPMIRQPPAPDC